MKVFRFASVTLIGLAFTVYCSSQDLSENIEKCNGFQKAIHNNAITIFGKIEALGYEPSAKKIICAEKDILSMAKDIKKDLKRYDRLLKKCKKNYVSLQKSIDNSDSKLTQYINDCLNILDNCIAIYSEANDYFFEGLETLSYSVDDLSYLETCKRSFNRLMHSLEYLKKELKYLHETSYNIN